MKKIYAITFLLLVLTFSIKAQDSPKSRSYNALNESKRFFSIYFSTGINRTKARENTTPGFTEIGIKKEYSFENALQMNLGILIPLIRIIDLDIGLSYHNNSYSSEQPINASSTIVYETKEHLKFISVPVKFKISPFQSRLRLYSEIGFEYARMLDSEISRGRSGTQPSTLALDVLDIRNRNLFFVALGVGLEYRFKRSNIFITGSYNRSISELVKDENRFESPDSVFDTAYVETNKSFSSIAFNVGYGFTIFKKS